MIILLVVVDLFSEVQACILLVFEMSVASKSR